MTIQPPGGMSSHGIGSPQDGDPVVQAVVNALQSLFGTAPNQSPLYDTVSHLIGEINPNGSQPDMETVLTNFFQNSYGTSGQDCWMGNALSSSDANTLVSTINTATGGWQCPAPAYTPMDAILSSAYNYYVSQDSINSNCPLTYFAHDLMEEADSVTSDCDVQNFFDQDITPMLLTNNASINNNLYTNSTYSGLTAADMSAALGNLSDGQTSYPLPSFANSYFQFAFWYYNQSGSKFGDELMQQFQQQSPTGTYTNWSSNFDPSNWISKNILGSLAFFENNPSPPTAFLTFAAAFNYSPSGMQQYMQAGYWVVSQQPNGNDVNTANAVFVLMNNDFANGNDPTADLQAFVQTAFNGMFANLPDANFDLAGAQLLESLSGLPAPTLQPLLFQTKDWIKGLSGADKGLAQAFLKQIEANGPNGTVANLVTWFNAPNPKAPNNDVYLTFPLVSDGAVQTLTNMLIAGNAEVWLPEKTPVDVMYIRLMTMGPPAGNNDAKLLAYLQGLCLNAGSNGEKSVGSWLNREIEQTPPFPEYQPLQSGTPLQFLTCFPFTYTATYYRAQLINLEGQNGPPGMQGFAQELIQFFNGYELTNPKVASVQGFENYLVNTKDYTVSRFCKDNPGLQPSEVASVLSMLGLTLS